MSATTTLHTDGPRRIELWVRVDADDACVRDIERRLARLRRRSTVGEFVVRRWDHAVYLSPTAGTPADRLIRDRALAFERWARERGTAVRGLEGPALVGVGRGGPERAVARLPTAVLAEYDGGRLSRVAPCESGARTVTERLAELERITAESGDGPERGRVGGRGPGTADGPGGTGTGATGPGPETGTGTERPSATRRRSVGTA